MIDSLTMEVVPKKDLTNLQRSEIIDLCTRAYEEDYEPYLQNFPGSTHILARWRGVLVSHALWVTRWLQSGNLPLLRTAYVEGVATEEAFRKRGYATTIMQLVAKEIGEYDLGGLSPAETSLYTRLGWEYWCGPLSIRTPQGLVPTPGERVMVLRLPNTPSTLKLDTPLSAEWREGELW